METSVYLVTFKLDCRCDVSDKNGTFQLKYEKYQLLV